MERTLVILKPAALQRELVGEILSRFERKGLYFVGMKMMQLNDALLNEHYGHLKEKSFFGDVNLIYMMTTLPNLQELEH